MLVQRSAPRTAATCNSANVRTRRSLPLKQLSVTERTVPSRAAMGVSTAQLVGLAVGRRQRGRHTQLGALVVQAGLVDPTAPGKQLVVSKQRLEPIKQEDLRKAEAFGPWGMLLIGMSEVECLAMQRWLQQMEPGFVVTCCPPALLAGGTLRQAVEDGALLPQRPWEQQPADAPPVAFFSGMAGEEQVALMVDWAEHMGLQAPTFASVTPNILDKPLCTLLAGIERAQAKQAPPGFDTEQGAVVHAAADAMQQQRRQRRQWQPEGHRGGGKAAAEECGEQGLRRKLQDYVILKAAAAPMRLAQLKDQIKDKMRQKKAQMAAAERQARKMANQDETDQLRQALAGGKMQHKGKQKKGGGSPTKGFGSK